MSIATYNTVFSQRNKKGAPTRDGWPLQKKYWGDSLGVPVAVVFLEYETPEQRAYRRFPITKHKPASGA